MRIQYNFFIKSDEILSAIPFISTPVNLVNIILKCALSAINSIRPTITESNRYFVHLHRKSMADCVLLLVPLVGNLVVARNKRSHPESEHSRKILLHKIKLDVNAIDDAPENFRNEQAFMLKAIKKNQNAIQGTSEELLNNPEFMLEAFKLSYKAKNLFNESLINNADFMLKAGRIDPTVIRQTGVQLLADADYMLKAIQIDYLLLPKSPLINDPVFMKAVVEIDPKLFVFAPNGVLSDEDKANCKDKLQKNGHF